MMPPPSRTGLEKHDRTNRRRGAARSLAPAWFAILFLLVSGSVLLCPSARADSPEAEELFTGAVRRFGGGWFDLAEKDFAKFVASFPDSTNRSQAVLLQSECRFRLKDFKGVTTLLSEKMPQAGAWEDQYLYWLAEAQSELEQFDAAAKTYATLSQRFPQSPLHLQAIYGEAFARFKRNDMAGTVDLLKEPASAFQQAAKASTNELFLVRGNLLLAEALYAQQNYTAAAQALTELAQRGLSPESEWQRQFLLTRIALAENHQQDALRRATNLVSIAKARNDAVLQARSLTLEAEILETTQPQAAADAYDQITKLPGVSPQQKRQALLKRVDLAVSQNNLTNAVDRLKSYLVENPLEPAPDLILITLGEVYLKQFYSLGGTAALSNSDTTLSTATNLLDSARQQFDRVVSQYTNSPYLGKAFLNRGWTFWEEAQAPGQEIRLADAENALSLALKHLPKSADQATARFKLADCLFRQKDYTNAIVQYQLLLTEDADVPEAKENLLDHALAEMVQAAIASHDLKQAQGALDRLLAGFPKSAWADRSLLRYAQALVDAGEFAQAHAALADFEKRFPNSVLLPEARLSDARAYARQGEWPKARDEYDRWLGRFTNRPDLLPEAQFDRAWCESQSGSDTNAFRLFSAVAQRFTNSPYAPLAHLWVADYFLNVRDFQDAEINYQLATNSAPHNVAEQAKLMAAKAAVFRQGYDNARGYLTNLVNDPQVRPEVGAEAWFMLGDVELEDPSRDSSTNRLAKFEDAINRFQRVVKIYPDSPLVPLAMGKIANCYFNLGSLNTNRYDMATNQYTQVLNHPLSDAATRAQAEVALGRVLERMAEQRPNRAELLDSALSHYLHVVTSKDPDPFWLGQAAAAAGTLAERLQRFDEAARLYQSMLTTVPSMKTVWETRLANLKQAQAP